MSFFPSPNAGGGGYLSIKPNPDIFRRLGEIGDGKGYEMNPRKNPDISYQRRKRGVEEHTDCCFSWFFMASSQITPQTRRSMILMQSGVEGVKE